MDKNDLPLVGVVALIAGFLLGTFAWSFDNGTLWSEEAAGWFQAVASVIAIIFAAYLPFRMERSRAAREELRSQKLATDIFTNALHEIAIICVEYWICARMLKGWEHYSFNSLELTVVRNLIKKTIYPSTLQYDALIPRFHMISHDKQTGLVTFHASRRAQNNTIETQLVQLEAQTSGRLDGRLISSVLAAAASNTLAAIALVERLAIPSEMYVGIATENLEKIYSIADDMSAEKWREMLVEIAAGREPSVSA